MNVHNAPKYLFFMKTEISKNAKLPFAVCRGSEVIRYNKAKKCSDKLKYAIEKRCVGDEISVKDYKNSIDSILLKHKINYKIIPSLSGSYGTHSSNIERADQINRTSDNTVRTYTNIKVTGHKIALKMNETNDVIKDKYVALHEARHLFDSIFNPKTLNIRYKNYKKDFHAIDVRTDVYNLFEEHSYNKAFKSKVKLELSSVDDFQAIDILQIIRAAMKSEKNAYNDELKYLLKNPVKNAFKIIDLYKLLSSSCYGKKLKMANELLEERLKIARKKLNN